MFDWIVGTVSSSGYAGIVLLMFLENVFPPIPSEMIMPLAGFVAARGELNVVLVVVSGVVGSLLGALPWYYAGLWLGQERMTRLAGRHGRWFGVQADDVGKAVGWFERHGSRAVLLGRLVPAVRTLISAPAGVARMPMPAFLLYSTIGTAVWTAVLTGAGYLLEAQYTRVADYLDGASMIVVAVMVVLYLYRVASIGTFGQGLRRWAEELRRDLRAVTLAVRDPRVPWYAKAVALLVALYAVSPIDLVPDVIPVLGQLDDMILVPLGILLVKKLIPAAILEEHRREAVTAAGVRRDWRAGAVVIGLWAIAVAFLVGATIDAMT